MACNCQNSKDFRVENQSIEPAAQMSGSQSVYIVDMPAPSHIKGSGITSGRIKSDKPNYTITSPSPILGPKPQNLDVKLNINYDEENHTIKLAVLINGENYEYSPMPISEFAQKLGIPRFDEFNHLERKG